VPSNIEGNLEPHDTAVANQECGLDRWLQQQLAQGGGLARRTWAINGWRGLKGWVGHDQGIRSCLARAAGMLECAMNSFTQYLVKGGGGAS